MNLFWLNTKNEFIKSNGGVKWQINRKNPLTEKFGIFRPKKRAKEDF